MREHFEEFVKRSQKPAFTIAELKRAVRSENFPHNQFQWKGNAHDADILSAEDVYLGLKLLSRLQPERAVDSMVLFASGPLRTAIVRKIDECEPERQLLTDRESSYKGLPIQLQQAAQIQEGFESAIDRALDKLMTRVRGR